jgi:hypothetical protein
MLLFGGVRFNVFLGEIVYLFSSSVSPRKSKLYFLLEDLAWTLKSGSLIGLLKSISNDWDFTAVYSC